MIPCWCVGMYPFTHLSVAVVEGVDLALGGPVQEGRNAARIMLNHTRMQICHRLSLQTAEMAS